MLFGFEISLISMLCKASHHSYDIFCLFWGFQMQAVLWYLDSTCTWLKWCAEFYPYPSRTRLPQTKHSLHALKAPAPGVAQFDCFSLSQDKCCMNGPEDTAQLPMEVPGASRNWLPPVKKAHFVAGKYGGAALHILGAAAEQSVRTSRRSSRV